jgi:hypothetical protein
MTIKTAPNTKQRAGKSMKYRLVGISPGHFIGSGILLTDENLAGNVDSTDKVFLV